MKDYVVNFNRSYYVVVSAEDRRAAQNIVARGDYDSRDEVVTTPSWDEDASLADAQAPDADDRSGFVKGQMLRRRKVDGLSQDDLAAIRSDTTPPVAGLGHSRSERMKELAGHWAEDATDRQLMYIVNLLRFRVVPDDLRTEAEQRIEDGLCKSDAYSLIPRLQAAPNAHLAPRSWATDREPFVNPNAPTEAEIEQAKREDYDMFQANGEEYPGQAEEIFGVRWIDRHNNPDRH